jgi:hypothetical protein
VLTSGLTGLSRQCMRDQGMSKAVMLGEEESVAFSVRVGIHQGYMQVPCCL